jgi:general stress protein 26
MVPQRALSEELADFIESGVSMLVGTRDAALRPSCIRALGASIHPDRRSLTIYLPAWAAPRVVADLEQNGRIAIAFSRPISHQTIQVKGRARAWRESGEADRAVQERYLAALLEQLHAVGLPRSLARRVRWWPSVAVEVELEDVFLQTPGPDAGRRLELSSACP